MATNKGKSTHVLEWLALHNKAYRIQHMQWIIPSSPLQLGSTSSTIPSHPPTPSTHPIHPLLQPIIHSTIQSAFFSPPRPHSHPRLGLPPPDFRVRLEEPAKELRVQRRRRHHDTELGAAPENLPNEAEQDVRVQRPLVRLVEDEDGVL